MVYSNATDFDSYNIKRSFCNLAAVRVRVKAFNETTFHSESFRVGLLA